MYNLAVSGGDDKSKEVCGLFGDKYDLTNDSTQANVLAVCSEDAEIPDCKLLFSVCDMTDGGMPEDAAEYCRDRGICIFNSVDSVRDFIENGNVTGSGDFPDISLGPFGDDVCRVIIMMKGIDDPILLAAMMFSGLNVRAIAGGLSGDYGCALVALREPVTRIPHVDGVLKVRVLQDI